MTTNLVLRPGQTIWGTLCYAEKRVYKSEPFMFFRVHLDNGETVPCNFHFKHSLRGLHQQSQIEICHSLLRKLNYEPGSGDWSKARVFCEIHKYKDKTSGKMRPCCDIFTDEEQYQQALKKRAQEAAEKEARDKARAARLGLNNVVF